MLYWQAFPSNKPLSLGVTLIRFILKSDGLALTQIVVEAELRAVYDAIISLHVKSLELIKNLFLLPYEM